MGDKPIFLRPVEIVTGTNDTIKCKVSGGGAYTSITINSGVYPSVIAVCAAFFEVLDNSFSNTWTIEDGGDTDGKYIYNQIVFGSAHTILIDQEATARMLGWGFNTSTAVTLTTFAFAYQPEYCWIPRFQVANQGRFYRRLDEEFSGKKLKTGILAGNSTGPTLHYRDLEFQNEKAYNVLEEGAETELYSNGSHVTKNLQYFVYQSMTASSATAGNPSPRCFWYVPDFNDILLTLAYDDCGPKPVSGADSSAGIRFDLSSSPDKWEFCQFEDAAIEPPVDVGVPTGRTLYNQANMTIHTVPTPYPTFTYYQPPS